MNDQIDEQNDSTTGEILAPIPAGMSPAIAAEINQQVATANQYPRRRDKDISNEIMGRATLNEEIASECMFILPRGNKKIPGPSIRFAEIVRASFGNIRVAARFVRIDTDDPLRSAVIVEAVAMDLQTNAAESTQVRRSIMTSGKNNARPQIYSADMISQTAQAAMSIARRNAILAVVPKAVWIEGYQRVVKVLKGDGATLAKRRGDIIAAFGRVGITPDRVFKVLGVTDENDITVEHMPELAGLMTAISEGEHPGAVFGRAEAEAQHDIVKNPLKDKATPAPQQQQEKTERAAPQKTEGELAQQMRAVHEDAVAEKPGPTKATIPENKMTQQAEPEGEGYTPESYTAMFLGFLKAAVSAKQIRDQWAKEKANRDALGISADSALLDPLVAAKENAITRLSPRT